jgi:hypothetical protein
MKSTLLSAREALKIPIPEAFEVEAPFRRQLAAMETQNKTSGILFIALFVLAGVAIIYLTASEARAWQVAKEKKP